MQLGSFGWVGDWGNWNWHKPRASAVAAAAAAALSAQHIDTVNCLDCQSSRGAAEQEEMLLLQVR